MSGALEALVHSIEQMTLEELRAAWNARYGAPPPLRSVQILRQLLAYRVQADALGGLDEPASGCSPGAVRSSPKGCILAAAPGLPAAGRDAK